MTNPSTHLAWLREIAKAATPGPWHSISRQSVVTSQSHPLCELSDEFHRLTLHGVGKDSDYIATFNPTQVLALLDALEAAMEALNYYSNQCPEQYESPSKSLEWGPTVPSGVAVKAQEAQTRIAELLGGVK